MWGRASHASGRFPAKAPPQKRFPSNVIDGPEPAAHVRHPSDASPDAHSFSSQSLVGSKSKRRLRTAKAEGRLLPCAGGRISAGLAKRWTCGNELLTTGLGRLLPSTAGAGGGDGRRRRARCAERNCHRDSDAHPDTHTNSNRLDHGGGRAEISPDGQTRQRRQPKTPQAHNERRCPGEEGRRRLPGGGGRRLSTHRRPSQREVARGRPSRRRRVLARHAGELGGQRALRGGVDQLSHRQGLPKVLGRRGSWKSSGAYGPR